LPGRIGPAPGVCIPAGLGPGPGRPRGVGDRLAPVGPPGADLFDAALYCPQRVDGHPEGEAEVGADEEDDTHAACFSVRQVEGRAVDHGEAGPWSTALPSATLLAPVQDPPAESPARTALASSMLDMIAGGR